MPGISSVTLVKELVGYSVALAKEYARSLKIISYSFVMATALYRLSVDEYIRIL